ncbi:MAG: MMPL family transporter [Betaproteobacteria bacterium]|nr:MMPL family transporter [Betaproteobacteria bacterium]
MKTRLHTAFDRFVAATAHVVFVSRVPLLLLFAAITVALAWSASQLRVDAGFNKMVPLEHEYMRTFTAYQKVFGGANRVLVALRVRGPGDIYTPEFLRALKAATDDVFFIPGVDRPSVTSLFTPNTRFIEVVEEGFAGGNVVPAAFRGTPADLALVRENVLKSGSVGRLVANDFRGALIRAELLEVDPQTGARLDYKTVADKLEALRGKYAEQGVDVHIIGFAKAVGDITAGAIGVLAFFGLAFVITALLLWWYTRSLPLTLLALVCALMPVLWLLGLLPLLGYGIDPMSILVPFLIFSIGVSHAVQMTNVWADEAGLGVGGLRASHNAFLKLFVPGTVALVTNALGFLVIMHIKIDVVRELGITASLGVLLMIVTNKLLLPILLSWLPAPSAPRPAAHPRVDALWRWISGFTERRNALVVLLVAAALLAVGAFTARGLRTGDLGKGIPELHDNSRYNRDNAAIVDNFAIGVDVLSVVVQTKGVDGACTNFAVMDLVDRFDFFLRNVAGVQSVLSLPGLAKNVNSGWNEGSPDWRALSRNTDVLAQSVTPIDTATGLLNTDCSAMQVLAFTRDHQGTTIAHIVREIKRFAAENATPQVEFRLAAGNVGVMAATNEAVDAAEVTMLLALFGAIILLCWITFRSWAAVLCIILPLTLVSILCNALMATLGIGLKVSTLPVIALGVGVGVDYGIYLFEQMQHQMEDNGATLREAFYQALRNRGTAAVFTAITMGIGVGTWAFSALKFQADMGLLLAFMFVVNMLGAIFLLPALAAFLVRPPAPAPASPPQPAAA